MKLLVSSVLLVVFGSISICHASGSGVGPRPGMEFFMTAEPIDLIRSFKTNSDGETQFQFKGFDKSQVEIYEINSQDISQKYLDAVERSQESHQWEPISVEGPGK